MTFLDSLFGRPPGKNDFAQQVLATLKKTGETRQAVYDERRFQIVLGPPQAPERFLYLGNAYEEYCNLPREARPGVLARYFDLSRQGEIPEFDAARPNLLPRVRHRAYYALLPLQLEQQFGEEVKPGKFEQSCRTLGEVFAASVVFDLPTSVAVVPNHRLAEWKRSFDDVLAIAIENLKAISTRPFERPRPGTYVSAFRDNHDPARLLLTELIRSLQVKGEPVAMVPNRDTLIVTGTEDREGLEEMADLAKVALLEPRSLRPFALRLDQNGSWRPWLPAPSSSAYARFRLFDLQGRSQDYDGQRELLNAHHEKQGIDLFVAKYQAVQNSETGELLSYATWTRDVHTLLPRAEQIALVDLDHLDRSGQPKVLRVPWDDVSRVAGHRMRKMDLFPERWEVSSFPSAPELAALSQPPPAKA